MLEILHQLSIKWEVTGLSFTTISEFKAEYVKAGGKIIDPVTSFLVKKQYSY